MPEAATGPLILGASGQVGYFLLQRLDADALACARHVPAWSTRFATQWHTFDLWRDDFAAPTPQLISAGPLDACVAWLERCGPGQLRNIVALSSMSAVHKLDSPSPRERDIAQRLRDSEQRLQAFARTHHITCTILRPTLIWGAGLDHSLTPFARRAARRGWALVPSGACGLRQPVHADDLASACLAQLERLQEGQACAALDVGGGEKLQLADMLRRTARSQQARVITLPIPASVLRPLGSALARMGVAAGAAAARAVDDQCVRDDAVWNFVGIRPRGFNPDALAWRAPDSV